MKKITVYSLSTCPACKKLKAFLDERSVPYSLIEVDTLDSGEQWAVTKELSRHNPDKTFPTTVFEEVLVGFDPEELTVKIRAASE